MTLADLGGRKFVLTVLVWISTSILVYFTKISDVIYSTVTLGTIGAFITSNTLQNIRLTNAKTP